ncbi:hypothetical protein [Devosia beringensis]|uniref:hypothetical protein n=1 Tax=Devosia beringensis TaxID=2657486 RepID=UPI00186BA142|nr:hypothetical protein [Devosia beringensis]
MSGSFWKVFWGSIGGGSALLGSFLGGYAWAGAGISEKLAMEKALSYSQGGNDVRLEYENAEYRDQTLASLLAVVRSPEVQQVLPAETNESLEVASAAIQKGDLRAAADALPSALLAVSPPDCLPDGVSALVRAGSAVSTCHAFGTRALIGNYDEEKNIIPVTLDGVMTEIGSSGAATSGRLAECDLLVENVIKANDGVSVRISFSC